MKSKNQISMEDTIIYDEDIVTSSFDSETMMMSIKREKYYGLDSVGSEIWKRLDKPITVKKLLELLAEEYDAEKKEIQNDVINFLNELLKEGMIKIVF